MNLVMTGSLQSFMQLLGVLVIFIFVLVLTYVTTKWIAGYQKSQSKNKNLDIVETLKIANNKYLEIVRAGEDYFVIAIGKEEVTFLFKLSAEQLNLQPEEGEKVSAVNFHDILEQVKNRLPKK
jgi:flagellar protein FliO/FliZ